MGDFQPAPEGLSIEAVDWLPSGGRSGLVRVRGHWKDALDLPVLVVERGGEVLRHTSLPDPRAGREPGAWRGAYVVHADLVAAADARLTLEFPAGVRVALPRPTETAPAGGDGGEVVDRAVLADRRARRAEAAEQAQARIAREALKAVEVLELRAADLEGRLEAVATERDSLAARAGQARGPDPEVNALRVRLAAAEARVQELQSAPISDRRAERLREALTTALTTVGELRMQLHEARVRSRTVEISAAADAVRLTVLASERAGLKAEMETLRSGLEEAEQLRTVQAAEIERGQARVAGAEAAHDETRRAFAERVGELREARERIGALEAELAALRAEIPARVQEGVDAAKGDFAAREAAVQAAFDSAREELERAAADTRDELARAEAELAQVEREAEMARAAAASAEMRLRAADVAHAAGAQMPAPAADREQLAAVTAELASARAATSSLMAELEQARTLLVTQGEALEATRARALGAEEDAAVVAGLTAELDIARSELAGLAAELETERARRRELETALAGAAAAAEPPAPAGRDDPAPFAPPEPGGPAPFAPPVAADLSQRAAEQERAAAQAERTAEGERVVADLAAAAEKLRARPEIVSAGAAPARVATGRAARDYPALRGALVKLAHDDPQAAAQLLAGLLPAQWRVLDEPVDYDLTIREAGTYAVTVTAGAAHVRPVAGPRREAEFHLRTDALTLAEMLAGHGPKPRRLGGRAKVSGKRRRLRSLEAVTGDALSLPDAVRAGARLDPELVLRTLAYAVHPAWTAGHAFTIAHTFTGPEGERTLYLTARDGRGLTVTHDPPEGQPQATVVLSRAAFEAMLMGDAPPPGERPATRGDHRAAQTLRAWADRARAGG